MHIINMKNFAMRHLKIPDLLIMCSNLSAVFECSENLVFVKTEGEQTKLYFGKHSPVISNSPIARFKNVLRNKGFLSIGDRLMIRLENLREIIYEDFEYYIRLKDSHRIRISFKDVEMLKRSLRSISN